MGAARRIWIAWRKAINTEIKTKVKHLLGVIVVGFAMFGLITIQVHSLQAATRDADLRTAAAIAYEAEVRLYETQLVQLEQCEARITARAANRTRFIANNELLRLVIDVAAGGQTTDPRVAQIYELIDADRRKIDEDTPLLDPASCPERPSLPTLPEAP